jgi:hypothetical protein
MSLLVLKNDVVTPPRPAASVNWNFWLWNFCVDQQLNIQQTRSRHGNEHPMIDGKYIFRSHALRETSGTCNKNFYNQKTRSREDRINQFPYHFGRREFSRNNAIMHIWHFPIVMTCLRQECFQSEVAFSSRNLVSGWSKLLIVGSNTYRCVPSSESRSEPPSVIIFLFV